MRIIAGEYRGRRLLPPEDERSRPITDRVKQALFDRLTWQVEFGSIQVLDIFSGVGSLGLEALSRGSTRAVFVERDRGTAQRLQKNIQTLALEGRTKILSADALSPMLIDRLAGEPYGLIFLDPPYAMLDARVENQIDKIHAQIARLASLCPPGGQLVLRTDDHATVRSVEGWDEPVMHNYGSMSLHHFVRPGGPQVSRTADDDERDSATAEDGPDAMA